MAEDPYYDGFICEEDIKDLNDFEKRRKMVVPSCISLTDDEFISLEEHPTEKEVIIRRIIESKNPILHTKINNYRCIQVTTPNSVNSYKKHILDVERKVLAKEKFVMDVSKVHLTINSCQFYIDNKKKRVFVIVYNGEERINNLF